MRSMILICCLMTSLMISNVAMAMIMTYQISPQLMIDPCIRQAVEQSPSITQVGPNILVPVGSQLDNSIKRCLSRKTFDIQGIDYFELHEAPMRMIGDRNNYRK